MLGFVVLLVVCQACKANYADKLVKIQELIQEKEDLLGEATFDYYENGAYALEYKQGDLVTFRQEPPCAQGLQDFEDQMCTLAAVERKKRDMCAQMSENMEQLCGGKKRMSSEECLLVLQDMEEQGCGEFRLEKRASCPNDEWHLSKGICYRHYSTPKSFAEARKQCEHDNGGLATLERAIAAPERAFFNDVIKSSGTGDLMDKELTSLESQGHYSGEQWRDYYDYLDNWAWIGVKRTSKDGAWKWTSHHKSSINDWNDIKIGQKDWYTEQPTNGSTVVSVDQGNCVAYFQNDKEDDPNKGAWWNLGCTVKLPFLCEQDAS